MANDLEPYYWMWMEGRLSGPWSATELNAEYAAGRIASNSLFCLLQERTWKSLDRFFSLSDPPVQEGIPIAEAVITLPHQSYVERLTKHLVGINAFWCVMAIQVGYVHFTGAQVDKWNWVTLGVTSFAAIMTVTYLCVGKLWEANPFSHTTHVRRALILDLILATLSLVVLGLIPLWFSAHRWVSAEVFLLLLFAGVLGWQVWKDVEFLRNWKRLESYQTFTT